jgi:HD-like signal output (HDOD) protein
MNCPWCAHTIETDTHKTYSACGNCLNVSCFDGVTGPDLQPLDPFPDVRGAARPGSAIMEITDRLYGTIRALPTLPEVPQRVITMVHDPLCSAEDLAKTINEDAVLALRILKISNSVMYAGLSEVKDLKSACARIGMKTIANTMWSIINSDLYRREDHVYEKELANLWQHAVATARCAELLATVQGTVSKEAVFLAGLVHDIGKLALLEAIATHQSPVVAKLRQSPEAVREVVQRFHTLAGLHVAQFMNLPRELRGPLLFHHMPTDAPIKEDLAPAHVVSLANHVAHAAGYAMDDRPHPPMEQHPSIIALGLNDGRFARFSETLGAELAPTLDAMIAI